MIVKRHGRRVLKRAAPLLAAALTLVAVPAAAASPYSDINAAAASSPVTVQRLRGNISMLQGSGGNISVLTGSDGLFMVDAGIAVSQRKILAALRSIGPGSPRYVINTHWHWDHTDGNGWVRRTGATIIADRKTVRHLNETVPVTEWEHTFQPVAKADLPNQILNGDRTMRWDGEIIRIRGYQPSHTDGDLSVYFTKADVLATGDTFWNGVYPFIDYAAGGSIDGSIRVAIANIAMAGANTMVVPGHGPLGDRAQLVAFRDMLVDVRRKVATLKAQGKSLNQVVAAKPTAVYDAKWGGSVISGPLFTELVYRGV